jgi:hypothetical protein
LKKKKKRSRLSDLFFLRSPLATYPPKRPATSLPYFKEDSSPGSNSSRDTGRRKKKNEEAKKKKKKIKLIKKKKKKLMMIWLDISTYFCPKRQIKKGKSSQTLDQHVGKDLESQGFMSGAVRFVFRFLVIQKKKQAKKTTLLEKMEEMAEMMPMVSRWRSWKRFSISVA